MREGGGVEGVVSISLYYIQELLIRLTDDRDPFFLYTLSIGDDDFTQ